MTYSCCYVTGPVDSPLLGLILVVAASDWDWTPVERGVGCPATFQTAVALVDLTEEQLAEIGLRRWSCDRGLVYPSNQSLWLEE